MRSKIFAVVAVSFVSLTACATASPLTPADYQARASMQPITLELWNQCINENRNCTTARNVLVNDRATTPNILALFDGARREIGLNSFVGGFFKDVLLGPERRIRSCYQGQCVTTVYRSSPSGDVVNARSY